MSFVLKCKLYLDLTIIIKVPGTLKRTYRVSSIKLIQWRTVCFAKEKSKKSCHFWCQFKDKRLVFIPIAFVILEMGLKSDLCHQHPSVTVLNLSRVQRVKNSNFVEAQCCLSLIRSLHSIRTVSGTVCHNSNHQLQRWQLDKHQVRRHWCFHYGRRHRNNCNKLESHKKQSPDTSCFITLYWSLIILFRSIWI